MEERSNVTILSSGTASTSQFGQGGKQVKPAAKVVEDKEPIVIDEDSLNSEEETLVNDAEDVKFMKGFTDITVDELIGRGYVTHTVEVVKGFSVTMRTLTKAESLNVDKKVGEYTGTNLYVFNEVGVDVLTQSLLSINGMNLNEDIAKRKAQILTMSDFIVGAIWEEFRKLRKAVVILIAGGSKNSLAERLLGPELI